MNKLKIKGNCAPCGEVSWCQDMKFNRAANQCGFYAPYTRYFFAPYGQYFFLGFRLARGG